MNVTKRNKIDKEESFEKIEENTETGVSKKTDSPVTEDNSIDGKQQELAEMKTEKERRGLIIFLQTTKEIIMRFVLFGIVYLVINRAYKIFLHLFVKRFNP